LVLEFAQGLLFQAMGLVSAQPHCIGGMTEAHGLSRAKPEAQNPLFALIQSLNHLMEPEIIILGLLQAAITNGLHQRTT
jgi:hypothetical protein